MRPASKPDPCRAVPRLALFASALVLALTGCGEKPAAAPKAPPTPKATAWPMTRGGPALTGAAAAPVPREPAVAWTFT
ncbi:MAG: hypothetical protein ACKPB0_16800, partial [Opitutaceae bacterium]